MKKILAIAAVLGLATASVSNAAIVLTGNTNAEVAFVNGQFVWTLNVASNAPGGLIGGFDGALAGGAPSLAFQAAQGSSMGQVLLAGILPTPTAQNNAAIDESTDSQFKVLDADIISAVPPFETATTLGGGFTLGVAARAQSKSLVQIAAPNVQGNTINYSFTISEALPGDVVNLQTFTGALVVPEPSTIALGAFGLLGMVGAAVRRRLA